MAKIPSFYRGDTPLINRLIPRVGDLLTASPSSFVASFTMTSVENPLSDSGASISIDVTPHIGTTDELTKLGGSTGDWVASFQLTNVLTQPLNPDLDYTYDIQLRKTDNTAIITLIKSPIRVLVDDTRRVA